ncbi:MAG: hypothetical protein MK132_20735 [Lentisphaerales bacterium]|nr:hypothetical protein [Lentisphaerales bacterium]
MKYALMTFLAAVLLASCSKKEDAKTVVVKPKVEIPQEVFAKKLDKGVAVLEARKGKAGDKITVQGKIMGSPKPFVDGRASFIIGDPAKLTSCDLKEGDPCEVPWDVCCEDSQDIADATLSIQIVDANGKVLKTGLKGINGLKELSNVVIEGTVDSGSTESSMIVNASSITVVK